MRILIDGYNLMFAMGLLGKRLGPDRFRKVRHRFLNDLADALGPLDSVQTTVVFDASAPPPELRRETSHKGVTVVFAEGESADDRIERLIAAHSAPKTLTVVSSDNRIRRAASRRKAKALTTEDFWSSLESRVRQRAAATSNRAEPPAPTPGVSPEESAYWLAEFRDLAVEPGVREALSSDPSLLTDAEVSALEREIEREFDRGDGA
jgi:predicted RNA-binding protein with PIN domain